MKKLPIIALVLLLTAFFISTVSAQGIVAKGLKAGLNMANFSGDDVEDSKMKMGMVIGGFITYSVNEQLSLQPEIYYAMKGAKIDEEYSETDTDYRYSETTEGTVSLNYLEIPVLGVFSLNENLKLLAGPYMEIYLSGKSEYDSEYTSEYYDYWEDRWVTESGSESGSEDIESDDMTSPGFGLIVGAEYSTGQISIGARYSMGLSNIFDYEDADVKHQVIQILVGFTLQ